MSERLSRRGEEPRITVDDIVGEFQKRASLIAEREDLKLAHFEAEVSLRSLLVISGANRQDYAPYPNSITSELGRREKKYIPLHWNMLQEPEKTNRDIHEIDEALMKWLNPEEGPAPVIHVKSEQGVRQAGEILNPKENAGRKYRWLGYTKPSEVKSFRGNCVGVGDGFLYVASKYRNTIFAVNPLEVGTTLNLSVQYPDN
jgi:hypothetical protein